MFEVDPTTGKLVLKNPLDSSTLLSMGFNLNEGINNKVVVPDTNGSTTPDMVGLEPEYN